MGNISAFNFDLIDNHCLDDLLNLRILENRARSVSPEFLDDYDDDFYTLYLYDLIAYILLNSNNEDKIIDEEVIALFALCECKMLSDDFIILQKEKYEKLMNILRNGSISFELKNLLRSLYIYNAAYMENEFLINIGDINASLLEEKNRLLVIAKDEIKKKIVPEQLRVKMNEYIAANIKSSGRKLSSKVYFVRKNPKKKTTILNVRKFTKTMTNKNTVDLSYLVNTGKINIVDKKGKRESGSLKKTKKKVTQ